MGKGYPSAPDKRNLSVAATDGCLLILPLVSSAPPTEITVNEGIEVAVEDTLNVSHLDVGAEVLDHLIGLHHVAADLPTPGSFSLFSPNLIDVGQALHAGKLVKPSFQDRHRPRLVLQLAPLVLNCNH